jgi:hypothetical protein
MRHLIATLIVITLVGCTHDNTKLQERVAFWRAELARDIPNGTSQERVKEWGAIRKIQFDYLEQQHWLYANIESVPDSGIGLPCSQWNIILKVSVDSSGRTVSNNISTVGTCL